jgi:hypothetical protein
MFVSMAPGDTVVVDLPVLAPDSTPATATTASALDSTWIAVQFDDFLDPGASADQIGVRLTREGGDAPVVSRLFHERAYERYVDQVEDSFARLDSIEAVQAAEAAAAAAAAADTLVDSPAAAPDTAGADTLVADTLVADTLPEPEPRPIPPRLTGQTGAQAAPVGRSRPGRRIVGQLDGLLEPGVEYQVRVTDVVNINGLPGGGGDVTLTYEPPPEPAPDSAAAPDADDAVVPADSPVVPDTLGVGG